MNTRLLTRLRNKFWVYYYPGENIYKCYTQYGVRVLDGNISIHIIKDIARTALLDYMHENYISNRKFKIN